MLTKHVDSVDPISNIHESRNSAKKGGLPSLDNAVPPIQRIFDRTTAVSPTVSACGTSMRGTVGPLNSSANNGITSKQAYSCERFLPLCGHTTSPVVGSIIMHEKVPSRKIGTTAPYMSTNVHFNVTKKGSYSTQIYKDGLATVNDHIEQKVSSSDGSKNNLARYKLYDFKLSHAEKSSKRFPMSEQTVFDMAPNIPQSGFIDTTNRGYAAKSIIAPFSMKPASIGQNSFTSFVNDEYGTMRAQAGHARQADSFNCELSMATISRKISNEHDRSRHRNSQEGTISGQEYMKRLLQAHQVVDELLKSRGLIPEDEVDYLRNWRQKVNREPKIEERNAADVSDPAVSKNAESFDTSEASQQRCISNASDSGLSMDADSENDLRSSSKLRELNSQNSIVTDLLPFKKQETTSIKSVKVNIVKTMKHRNVYLKVIIRRPQHCWQYMDVKMGIEKKEAVSEKTTNSNATGNSKKSCNKRRQTIDGKTEQVKSGNEKNSLTQNKRLNQDHQMAMATASGQFKSTSSQELSSAKSNKSETGKKHNIFISKPKYEEVDVCCSFTNKICCLYKATISLPIARCAAVKQKSIAVRDKKLLEKKGKEPKSKCNKDESVHASLLAKTGKLPFNLKMIPELQNMENKRKIRVARKGEEMVESKDIITEIKKDILDLKKTKKCFKFPIPLKESEESHNLLPVKYTKKITPSQTRKTSPSSKQITVSRNLCLQSKLPRLETAMIMPLRSHKIKITKPVMIKQTVDNKKQQREGLLRANNPSVLKIKECVELKKTQKVLQNYTTVTTKYYQKILRSTAGNESNIMTGYEGNAGTDIRRAREHLRRVNFNKTSVKLESSTSFVHRISEDPVKLSDTSIPSLVTSSEQGSSVLSVVKKKAKKKVSGTKMDKGSKDRSAGTHTTSIEKAERNSDILDRELVNAYRRTQRIPKPQARIPAWNVCDERKQAAGTIWSPPKLCHGTLPTAPPVVPCFIRVRTPTPIDIAATLSTPAPTITVLRHVPAKHLPILTPRPKNTLSSDSGVTIAGSLQQHSPSNQFGVTLKRVDRSTMQKSKPRGAITQSAPKKPWVPKWRRIQRYTFNRLTFFLFHTGSHLLNSKKFYTLGSSDLNKFFIAAQTKGKKKPYRSSK